MITERHARRLYNRGDLVPRSVVFQDTPPAGTFVAFDDLRTNRVVHCPTTSPGYWKEIIVHRVNYEMEVQ